MWSSLVVGLPAGDAEPRAPWSSESLYGDASLLLTRICERLGLPSKDAELVRMHSNAVFVLPSAGLVIRARMATSRSVRARIAASLTVTRWLASIGFPTVEPAEIGDQPILEDGWIVSVWKHIPKSTEILPAAGELGGLLRKLHDLPQPPFQLEPFRDPLSAIAGTVADTPDALNESDRLWLTTRIAELRTAWDALRFTRPPGLVHGDAHPNNVIRSRSRDAYLCDWDSVGFGPREWDLTPVLYSHRRLGLATDPVDAFMLPFRTSRMA